MVKLSFSFLGGVAYDNNLTGSCVLATIRRGKQVTNILVDAGMWQGNQQEFYQRNSELKVSASMVHAVVLTHSHVDHIGRLPLLAKRGFRGHVFCTKPTKDFCGIMLEDSAKIIESEARFRKSKERNNRSKNGRWPSRDLRKKKESNPNKDNGILYSIRDVENALSRIKNGGFDYREWVKIDTGIEVKFYPSGHVLGGAICVIRVYQDKSLKNPVYIGFSGDLGRKDGIILPPPELVLESLDYFFVESTYGGEVHPERDYEINALFELVREADAEKRRILVPSFALERAQEIIYLLSDAMMKGVIPQIPIYLDSPMATKITDVFSRNWNTPMFRDQAALDFNPFELENNPFLKTVDNDELSVRLTKSRGPYLVIAGAGMCEAGRIRNHLRENLSNDKTTVCLIGYMANGTLGRKLQENFEMVRMNGQEIQIKAKVISLKSFSAHADGNYIVEYTNNILADNAKKCRIFIIHGDEKKAFSLWSDLLNELGPDWKDRISVPTLNQKVVV